MLGKMITKVLPAFGNLKIFNQISTKFQIPEGREHFGGGKFGTFENSTVHVHIFAFFDQKSRLKKNRNKGLISSLPFLVSFSLPSLVFFLFLLLLLFSLLFFCFPILFLFPSCFLFPFPDLFPPGPGRLLHCTCTELLHNTFGDKSAPDLVRESIPCGALPRIYFL